MYGKDTEEILNGINDVKDQAMQAIIKLANGTGYRLQHIECHAGCGSGTCIPQEVAKPYGDATSPVQSALKGIDNHINKMKSFGDNLYVDPKKYNNAYGSPFTEIQQMASAVAAAVAYNGAHSPFNWVGEKAAMLSLLAMVVGMSTDCKQAMTEYQDSSQRAYDEEAGTPSITWVKDSTGQRTAGNTEPISKLDANWQSLGLDSVLGKLGGLGMNIGGK